MTTLDECGFTLRHWRQILEQALGLGFQILPLREAGRLEVPAAGRRQMILRHDIDYSLEAALRMATLEQELGVTATYGVLLHSPTYNMGEGEALATVRAIAGLGHEIALHYDLAYFEAAGIAPREGIELEAQWLGRMAGGEIRSVAQHRPGTQGRRAGVREMFGGRLVDAYDEALTRRILYLSDSRRQWREGCVHEHLARATQLQLLVHPLWWDAVPGTTRRDVVRAVGASRTRAIEEALERYLCEMDRSGAGQREDDPSNVK